MTYPQRDQKTSVLLVVSVKDIPSLRKEIREMILDDEQSGTMKDLLFDLYQRLGQQ